MPQTFDVIIVGGGPAGSGAGAVLAKSGASALILDKQRFPREKLCAGLLTWKTMDALERIFDASPESLCSSGVVNHRTSGYRIRFRDRILVEGDMFYPFHFVKRRDLDAFLLSKAAEAGVEVLTGERVEQVDALRGVVVTASGRTFKAGRIIGADGAMSAVRAGFPIDPRAWRVNLGTGVEVFLRKDDPRLGPHVHEDLRASFPTVYAGFIPAGYAWVFPHRDRLVLGLGSLNRAGSGRFRQAFAGFLRFLGLPESLAGELRGHPLPYGNYIARPAYGRALLAGDAAGYVETLFGEGIYYALRSGELAGAAVAKSLQTGADPLGAYEQGLQKDIFPELVYSRRLRRLLYSSLRYGMLPILLFLRGGGNSLVEMVHGVRSYRWLRKRASGPRLTYAK